MAKKTVDVYVFDVSGMVRVQRNVVRPGLEGLQKIVGGLIEFVYDAHLSARRGVDVIVNEEGLLLRLERNQVACIALQKELVGPVLVIDSRKDREKSPFDADMHIMEEN